MEKCKVEKFSLTTIKDLLSKSDLDAVRLNLSQLVGVAVLEVSGKVRKCAKREGICRLMIEPGDVIERICISIPVASISRIRPSPMSDNREIS